MPFTCGEPSRSARKEAKGTAFRASLTGVDACPRCIFSRGDGNESRLNAIERCARRLKRIAEREIFVHAEILFDAAATLDAFAGVERFRHRHMNALAPLVAIRQTDFQFKIVGAAVARGGT